MDSYTRGRPPGYLGQTKKGGELCWSGCDDKWIEATLQRKGGNGSWMVPRIIIVPGLDLWRHTVGYSPSSTLWGEAKELSTKLDYRMVSMSTFLDTFIKAIMKIALLIMHDDVTIYMFRTFLRDSNEFSEKMQLQSRARLVLQGFVNSDSVEQLLHMDWYF
jgi:hypothetical protein